MQEKSTAATADELSPGRVYTVELHLRHFQEWLGKQTAVLEINGETLAAYRTLLLQKVASSELTRATAKDRMMTLKSFVAARSWQCDAIPTLPRTSSAIKGPEDQRRYAQHCGLREGRNYSAAHQGVVRTRLYVLLMLTRA